MINHINWFEIPVNDMDRAKKFYESILETQIDIQQMDDFTMGWFPSDMNQPGASGTLMKANSYIPSHSGTVVYFSVPEIEDVLGRIEEAGGKILNAKTSIGKYGYVAHFEDTEGNRVALHQVPSI